MGHAWRDIPLVGFKPLRPPVWCPHSTPVGFPRHLAGTWRTGAHLIPPCIVPSTTPTRHLLGLSVKTSLHTQPPLFLGAPRYVAWRGVAFFPHVQNAYRFPRR